MDYFHADRRPAASPGPDAFLRRAIPVFAQLTYRERLRESRPASFETLSHGSASRSGARRWPMPTKGATGDPCGVLAHHPGEDAVRRRRTGVLTNTRLRPGLDDHRSVPVGLSVGALPHHQGGGEDAHAARPAGQHSEFYPHLGWQAARRSCPRYALARKPEPSTSWIVATSTLPAFMCCTKPGPSSSRIRFKDPESGKTLVFITNNFSLPAATICALYKSRWQVELFFKWIKQHLARIKQFYGHVGERGEDADLDCRLGLRPRRHRQEAPRPGRLALHFVTDPLGDPLKCPYIKHRSCACRETHFRTKTDATLRANLFDF